MKKQIVVIHGADTFETYEQYLSYLKDKELDFERLRSGTRDWKSSLAENLGPDVEVLLPSMPNKNNARYLEWKIWFEKLVPFLEDGVVLVGHSMGAVFLAKYLSENRFPKKVAATFLVAGPYDESHEDAEYLGDFALAGSLDGLNAQGGKICLYHSKDDPVVPFQSFEKYQEALPQAAARVFEDRGHFNQPEFSELVEDLRRFW